MKVDLSHLSLTIVAEAREFTIPKLDVPAQLDVTFSSPFAAGMAALAGVACPISIGHARIELDETAVAAMQEAIIQAFSRRINAVAAADVLENLLFCED